MDLGGSAPDGGEDQASTDAVAEAPAADASEAASSEPPGLEAGPDVSEGDTGSDATSARDAPGDTAAPDAPEAGFPSWCDDNLQDGDETDVDCGGSCRPCGLAQSCLRDSDCGTWPGCDPVNGGCACDALTQKCVYDHCSDHKLDRGETSIDCGGGECPGCGPGKACILDSDCSTNASGCDTSTAWGCACDAVTRKCVYNHCYDHKWDFGETALDCGGSIACSRCALGQGCQSNGDCTSSACDALSLTCVSNQCDDHHQDGHESDVDCGGIDCSPCPVGKKCQSSFDCMGGHTCSSGTPHVCI